MSDALPRIAVPLLLDHHALLGLDRGARVADMGGVTMGTYWKLRLAATPEIDLAAVKAAVEARLDGIVAEMSHWDPDSLLSRFNVSAAGEWTALPPDFAAVMDCGLALAERTDGAFHPAIGRLTDIYGLGPNPAAALPGEAAIEAALGASGWNKLAFDPEGKRLYQPGGLWLDLSGIAKGYAVDAVVAELDTLGLRHALMEIGGECVGRGIRPDGDPWWVELENPPGVTLPSLRVALHQLAVATSGNYVRGDHTLDPRTGRAIHSGVICASVLHASAMQADGWATAISVLGSEEGTALARSGDLAARMILVEAGEVIEWISPALQAMIDG